MYDRKSRHLPDHETARHSVSIYGQLIMGGKERGLGGHSLAQWHKITFYCVAAPPSQARQLLPDTDPTKLVQPLGFMSLIGGI